MHRSLYQRYTVHERARLSSGGWHRGSEVPAFNNFFIFLFFHSKTLPPHPSLHLHQPRSRSIRLQHLVYRARRGHHCLLIALILSWSGH